MTNRKFYFTDTKGNIDDPEDYPLKFIIWEYKEDEDEDLMMAWTYEKEFAELIVNTLNEKSKTN